MTNEQIAALGQIAKSLIWAMGMQAENMQRIQDGYSLGYSDVSFFQEAENIDFVLGELTKEVSKS